MVDRVRYGMGDVSTSIAFVALRDLVAVSVVLRGCEQEVG